MSGLGRKVDQKQDEINHVSQTVQLLGRTVLMAKQTIPNASLDSLIEHRNFDLIVDTVKQLSTDKERPALNVGLTTGHVFTKVCTSKDCAALRVDNHIAQQDATNFLKSEWNNRVHCGAVRCMQKEKRRKLHRIPLMEDLQMFHK